MKRAEVFATEFFLLKDGQSQVNLISCIRRARRDCLTTVLAWCHKHPDAPAQCLIKFIHEDIHDGNL